MCGVSLKLRQQNRGDKLSKATLYEIKTFDINNGYTFMFDYIGTENIDGNILRIYKITEPESPIIVQKQFSKKSNTLTKATANLYKMTNGEIYFADITMCEGNTELTNTRSDKKRFFCFTTPILSFKNTETFSQPIKNSSFIVELNFEYDKTGTYQDELNEYKVIVYPYKDDVNQLQIYETKRAYARDLNNLTAYITDLDSNIEKGKSYYLKAIGITKHGVNIESELLRVDILNTSQYVKTAFNADVKDDIAAIYLSSNLINIEGESEGNISFENGKILVGEDGVIYFRKDISVESVEHSVFDKLRGNNFMLSIKFSDFPIDSDILILKDKKENSIITLSSVSNKIHSFFSDTERDPNPNGIGILKLTASDKVGENIIRSDPLNLNYITDDICRVELLVIIERIKGAYNLKVKIL